MSDENETSDTSNFEKSTADQWKNQWEITFSGTGDPPFGSGTTTYPPNWVPQQTLDYTSEGDSVRNYKCPRCGGEFNHWDTDMYGNKVCPFCGLKRHKYGYS